MTNSLKQKTKVLTISRTTNYFMSALIFVVAFSYIYFANIAIRTVTILEKIKYETRLLSVEVSEMESKRLVVENDINILKAEQLGFVKINNPVFIVKNSQKPILSLKTN